MTLEKDVKLGSVGDLKLDFAAGKATLTVSAAVLSGAGSANLGVTLDAAALVDLLKAAVEKAAPASAPVDEAVFAVIKAAVVSI